MSDMQGELAHASYADILKSGEGILEEAGVPEPRANAWYLFSHCFHMDRSRFFLHRDEYADVHCIKEYKESLARRSERVPLEHIIQGTEFMGLPFYVNRHVLVPRQDTECVVEEALKYCAGKSVLDLCTGSGCIGISLAVLGNCREVTLADISSEALEVAKRNAKENDVDVTFVESDLFSRITGRYDLIVSNPPYIASGEIPGLMPEVRDYDPLLALDGGEDGLLFYRKIIQESCYYLTEEGQLCFEIGCGQGNSVRELMEQQGFVQVEIRQDLAGLDRVVLGRRRQTCLIN